MTTVTVSVLMEAGVEALHRVITVLAHQRADVRSLALIPPPSHPGLAQLTLELGVQLPGPDQLVKRLRRAQCVHAVTAGTDLARVPWTRRDLHVTKAAGL